MVSVIFRAFRAIDEPESCDKFVAGHRSVLEAYGITMITSNNAQWAKHKNTYVILAEAPDDGRALGGVRIQIADDDFPLPIAHAVGLVDEGIHALIKSFDGVRIAEACGLWNSREIHGYGYSFFLLRAAIALANLLGVKALFALAAPVTVEMCLNAGFKVERNLGKEGFFNYPKLDLVATAMAIRQPDNLTDARAEDRIYVQELVAHPNNLVESVGPKGVVTIDYRLNILA